MQDEYLIKLFLDIQVGNTPPHQVGLADLLQPSQKAYSLTLSRVSKS